MSALPGPWSGLDFPLDQRGSHAVSTGATEPELQLTSPLHFPDVLSGENQVSFFSWIFCPLFNFSGAKSIIVSIRLKT